MANPIYTNEMRITSAENLLSSISRVDPTPDYLYIYIAKNDPWPLDTASDEIVSDPIDKLSEEVTTRGEMLAMKRLTSSDMVHVIRRVDWTTGTVYTQWTDNDTTIFSLDFYVLTDDFYVYKCLNNNSGANSTSKPTGTSTSPITTADGYEWKFMFDITTADATKFLTAGWMPIRVTGNGSSLQDAVETAASYTAGDPLDGHGANAYRELGAYYVMITASLENTEGGVFPIGDDFRKVGLVINPLLSGSSPATATVYDASATTSGQIDQLAGRIIYEENRSPIVRAVDQIETVKVVITF